MSYTVKSTLEKDSGYGEERVDTKTYPAHNPAGSLAADIDLDIDLVTSSLVLAFSEKSRGAFKLSKHKKYRVMFIQNQANTGRRSRYELFAANEYSTTKQAFNRLDTSLGGFIATGQVFFTKELLMEVVLPEPLHQDDIGLRLVEVMEKSPTSHPEWFDVIQALLAADELPLASDGPTTDLSKLAFFKRKLTERNKKRASKPHILESVAVANMEMLTSLVPAAPTPPTNRSRASNPHTDEEDSERVWSYLRRGTLSKYNSQDGGDKVKTWLIDAVEKQYMKSSLKLIMSRVSTNDQHPKSGDSALHIAVRLGNLTLVKVLLAYQAIPDLVNANDETPLSIARQLTCKNAGSIVAALEQILKLQARAKVYFAQNMKLPEKKNSSDTFLLSLDGGGMRSVIMCHILAAISRRMKELDSSCKPLQSYFDYIAGTSAGAIIGGLLAYANISVPLTGIYLYKFMVDVFCTQKSDRCTELKGFITDIVGEETTMSALKRGNLIVTTTIANVRPNKLHLMTSYGEPRDGKPGPDERKLWEALVASSAAPTYFPSFDSFLDGGLMANNPTLPAMADIFRQAKKDSRKVNIGCVLSLGTGYTQTVPVDNFEVFVPGFTIDIAQKLINSSMGLVNLLSHFAEQTTQSNGETVNEAEMWCDSLGASFFRFSPLLSEEVAPDMSNIEDLASLLFETEMYVLEECCNIDNVAKTILCK